MKWLSSLSPFEQLETAPHRNGFKGIDGALSLSGPLAEVELNFNFENETKKDIELHLIFPLAQDAVLLSVDLKINENILSGKILPAETADQDYEDAISDGDTPVLVERLEGNQIRLQLGNLTPKETATVTLRYAQLITPKSGECKFTLPTTIAPRFGAADYGMGIPAIPKNDVLVAYPIRLAVHFDPDQHTDLVCPSKHDGFSLNDPRADYALAMPEPGEDYFSGLMNRDLVLTWRAPSTVGQATVVPANAIEDHTALLAQFVLPLPDNLKHKLNPITLKILVDCSGSMAGPSIEAARNGAMHALDHLHEDERFSVSLFGSSVQDMTQGLQTWRRKNRGSWRRVLTGVDATLGGTELEIAVKHCLTLGREADEKSAKEDAYGDILLITDGQVSDISRLVKALKKAKHRIFAIGVGSAPAESQLAALAKASGGECLLVSPGEDLRVNIERLMARMRAPQVKDMKAILNDTDAVWLSELPSQAAATGAFQLYGLLPTRAWSGQIIVSAMLAGAPQLWRITLPVHEANSTSVNSLVHYQRITTLPKKQQAAYALQHELLTDDTRLLCIYERAANGKAGCMPKLDDIAHMSPAVYYLNRPAFCRSMSYMNEDNFIEFNVQKNVLLKTNIELTIEKSSLRQGLLPGYAASPESLKAWLSTATSMDDLCFFIRELEAEGLPADFRKALCNRHDAAITGHQILAWLVWLYEGKTPKVLDDLIAAWENQEGAAPFIDLETLLKRIAKKLPIEGWQVEIQNRLAS